MGNQKICVEFGFVVVNYLYSCGITVYDIGLRYKRANRKNIVD